MTNPLDEQRAAHVRCLQDFAAAYDAESANGLALRAAIEALTAPPLCAKGEKFLFWADRLDMLSEMRGCGSATLKHCARIIRSVDAYFTPAQPKREVTDGESALWALRQILHDLPSRREWLDPQLEAVARDLVTRNPHADLTQTAESFANGGDGNG